MSAYRTAVTERKLHTPSSGLRSLEVLQLAAHGGRSCIFSVTSRAVGFKVRSWSFRGEGGERLPGREAGQKSGGEEVWERTDMKTAVLLANRIETSAADLKQVLEGRERPLTSRRPFRNDSITARRFVKWTHNTTALSPHR
ncbi:MAG: hypothetical protein ACKERG_04230 [Candidatus Hodgkinia cicadicola]